MQDITSLNEARAEVESWKKTLNDLSEKLRELENKSDRLTNRRKEVALAAHSGDDQAQAELRDLTKLALEHDLEVANVRFAMEDAEQMLARAKVGLERAAKEAKKLELSELAKNRLEMAEEINDQIDTLQESLKKYNEIAKKQSAIASELGVDSSAYDVKNGPVARLVRLLEEEGGYSEEWNARQQLIETLRATVQEKQEEINFLRQQFEKKSGAREHIPGYSLPSNKRGMLSLGEVMKRITTSIVPQGGKGSDENPLPVVVWKVK